MSRRGERRRAVSPGQLHQAARHDVLPDQRSTKKGKPRYVFAPEPKGTVLDHIPEGREIVEAMNRTHRQAGDTETAIGCRLTSAS